MTDIPETTDVLIVGMGPVGAALTALLGARGVRTLTIERGAEIFRAPRAIALDNEALRILQMVGLDETGFDRVVIPMVKMHCPYVGEFSHLDTTGEIDAHPKLVTFFQPELEAALRAKAFLNPTSAIALQTELIDFHDDGASVTARLRQADGVETTVRARYLVGADGAGSIVRTAIGEAFDGETFPEDWLIIDAKNVPGAFDHVEFLCDPKRPTPHMIAPGGRTRWEFMLNPGETLESIEAGGGLAKLLKPWCDLDAVEIERKAVYRFHARCCDHFRKGRVLLVGDAAHITPPFAGQGLVAGLRDVANLAWKLAFVVQGRAAPAILDTYDEERRPHARRMIALAQSMGRSIMPRSRARAFMIHGLMKLASVTPGLGKHLRDGGGKPKNEFDSGLFAPGKSRLRRGGQLPQGRVRTSAGRIIRSDDALGSGLTLVGFGVDPAKALDAKTLAAWTCRGGTVLTIGRTAKRPAGALETLDGAFDALLKGGGWIAVVRPDRAVLHEGPLRAANRMVRETLNLLGSADQDLRPLTPAANND